MPLNIRHDQEARRFVADTPGGEAYLTYSEVGAGRLEYDYTFVPPELRGKRLGEEVAAFALQYARDHGFRVIPSCGFVRRVAMANAEFRDLVE